MYVDGNVGDVAFAVVNELAQVVRTYVDVFVALEVAHVRRPRNSARVFLVYRRGPLLRDTQLLIEVTKPANVTGDAR